MIFEEASGAALYNVMGYMSLGGCVALMIYVL